jgi:hypothetical protein
MKEQNTNYFNNSKILSDINVRLFSIHSDKFNCAFLKSNSLIRCSTSESVSYTLSCSVVSVYRK